MLNSFFMSIFEIDVKKNKPDHLSQIYFGMGCFWGAERRFWHLDGLYTTDFLKFLLKLGLKIYFEGIQRA